MKRFTPFILAVTAAMMLTTSACKKTNDIVKPDGATTGTQAFVGKRLILSAFTMSPAVDFDGDGKVDPDLMAFMQECDKDNTIVFEKGGRLSGDNGALRCDDDEPATGSAGTWSYDEQTKILRIIDAEDKTDISEWHVLEASAKTLKVEVSVVEDGVSLKATMTWKAI
ncbi:hypothetical protein HNV11_02480 [Spirosoma taeanense]|uniref:Lipocalin-like domain-containing protein n=1 Tax=Spirosoma taeanense TaxID=2735870 RepID=A0A6M5Y0L4_9BACT|nr:hypothetical protein [Spirosoma taeanense]QJW88318.1 hypothetical protein HNV11_02480 [Spirosoma taeanense]